MPIPKPERNENKNEFISRCMRFVSKENKWDQKQQLAICFSQWENKKNEAYINDFLDN